MGKPGSRQPTTSPITWDPFVGRADIPASLDLRSCRVYLEMDGLPDTAASVRVNGQFAGGCVGQPAHVNVTAHLKAGVNEIVILPQAPKSARLVILKSEKP